MSYDICKLAAREDNPSPAGIQPMEIKAGGGISKCQVRPGIGRKSAWIYCMNKFHQQRNDHGFSLVELAVMLSMATIMAAVSIPILSSSMRGLKLGSDAKSVATTLTYARVSAASHLTRYRMSIDAVNDRWSLLKWDDASHTYKLEQAVNNLSEGLSNSGIHFKDSSSTAPAGFPLSTSTAITFDSRGIPMEGERIIYLAGRDSDFAVSVSRSGKIQLWHYEDRQWTLR